QTFAAITQNSQSTIAPISESTQTLSALSSAIVGVVNISFPCGSAQNPITKEEWKEWKKNKKPEEDWKNFLLDTKRKNKIKEARDRGIDPPPKPDTDDEMDNRSIESYESEFSRQNSITFTNTDIPDDNISELSTITSQAMRSSRSSILATNSNIEIDSYEANDDNDIFDLSTITSHTTRFSRSSISTQSSKTSFNIVEIFNRLLAASSTTIEPSSSELNNNNTSTVLRSTKPSGSSRIPTWLSKDSNKIEN
ncbi:17949_t:CDS:2, partial [Gigaspora rosea]